MASPPARGGQEARYSLMERVMISHAHPAKLGGDLAGVGLGMGLVWRHRPIPASAAIFGFSLLGSYVVGDIEIDRYADTKLGRWTLGQAKPLNLVVRAAGFGVLLTGLCGARRVWCRRNLRHALGRVLSVPPCPRATAASTHDPAPPRSRPRP